MIYKILKNFIVLPLLSINPNGKSYFFIKLRILNEKLRKKCNKR